MGNVSCTDPYLYITARCFMFWTLWFINEKSSPKYLSSYVHPGHTYMVFFYDTAYMKHNQLPRIVSVCRDPAPQPAARNIMPNCTRFPRVIPLPNSFETNCGPSLELERS
uniref:Uncharacterized protein n=1 Tax=Arundo donax TaxID=35708 RepID=A0A0A9EN73_ARUDO